MASVERHDTDPYTTEVCFYRYSNGTVKFPHPLPPRTLISEQMLEYAKSGLSQWMHWEETHGVLRIADSFGTSALYRLGAHRSWAKRYELEWPD